RARGRGKGRIPSALEQVVARPVDLDLVAEARGAEERRRDHQVAHDGEAVLRGDGGDEEGRARRGGQPAQRLEGVGLALRGVAAEEVGRGHAVQVETPVAGQVFDAGGQV